MAAPKGNKYAVGPHKEHKDKLYTDEFIEEQADLLLEWMKKPHNIFFRAFALEQGYSSQRMYEWNKRNKVFAEAFETVRDWQEIKLVNSGLFERTNAGFTKFLLVTTHDYVEPEKGNDKPPAEYDQLLNDLKPRIE